MPNICKHCKKLRRQHGFGYLINGGCFLVDGFYRLDQQFVPLDNLDYVEYITKKKGLVV